MVVVCITQLEKAWNKGKAEIFEQENLVRLFQRYKETFIS
jgi:radical SAM superfamily enzyme